MKAKFYDYHFLIKIAFIITIIASVITFPFLPNALPMQYSGNGSVNWTLPKFIGILFIPCIMVFVYLYFVKGEGVGFRCVVTIYLFMIFNLGYLFYTAFIFQ